VALFAGRTLAITVNLLARRPLLEIGEEGVRRPAGWPRRTSLLLRWDDLAGVCAWSEGLPAGRGQCHHLTFLPRGDAAQPDLGAEILAIKVRGVPGRPDPRWSFPVTAAWDRPVEDVVAAVRRHRADLPCVDRRDFAGTGPLSGRVKRARLNRHG
jgi:hypothetical protein